MPTAPTRATTATTPTWTFPIRSRRAANWTRRRSTATAAWAASASPSSTGSAASNASASRPKSVAHLPHQALDHRRAGQHRSRVHAVLTSVAKRDRPAMLRQTANPNWLATFESGLIYSVHVRTRKSAGESTLISAAFRRCEVFGSSRGQSIVFLFLDSRCVFDPLVYFRQRPRLLTCF